MGKAIGIVHLMHPSFFTEPTGRSICTPHYSVIDHCTIKQNKDTTMSLPEGVSSRLLFFWGCTSFGKVILFRGVVPFLSLLWIMVGGTRDLIS